MNHVTAEIEGLDFEHSCVGLARQLERRAGIQRVDVDERANRATITYDDTRLNPRDVRRLIAESGYALHDTSARDAANDTAALAVMSPDD